MKHANMLLENRAIVFIENKRRDRLNWDQKRCVQKGEILNGGQ